MAFQFGNPGQSAFGATQAKAPTFGSSFGAPAASTASTGFGFGSSFNTGAQQQAAPAFGSTFGAPAATATPSFGTSFGAPASSAPSFGTTFGAPAAGTSTFGAPAGNASLFGASAAKPSLFGAPTSSAPSLFSTPASGGSSLFTQAGGLFGNTQTSAAPSLFGTSTSQAAPLFGNTFGNTQTSTPSLFGNTGTTQPGFGGGGLFGQTATTSAPSLFGTGGFGTTTGFGNTTGAFGGFGTGTSAPNLFGNTFGAKPATAVAPTHSSQTNAQQVVASVYAINVFNDERDDILKKWNMLQACWGTGKGYYNSSQPPIEYKSQNPFHRFKTIGYNMIPEQDNSEGIVKLLFNKKASELQNQKDVLKNGIGGILGNKPNLTIEITQIKAASDSQTEVRITVSEKGVTGCTRKIPATDLASFLNQQTQKQQLSNVGVVSISPFITPSRAELEEYLKNPPTGIDAQMWQAAIADNPNPKKYIPVPINGFSDLRSRMLNQEYQTGLHQAFLEKVNKEITNLKTKHASSTAQISELKQKFLELQHRILRILVKQESTRKVGLAVQPEEEMLRGRLEIMHSHLNVPKQYKGQINELLSHVKMIEGSQKQYSQNYRVDADAQEEIKQFLKMEQNGISQLINIINGDLQSIKIINEGLQQVVTNNGR
ncbi:unnamed protein product [Brassicogethes aeneus]|uniref:Uncharacterized protein n=1 Tax=Brassicogethes aeneus TaxID=1431903 RepID=A0A9P0FGQ0_BRAAE|nr:unnamed protein product [Brassicogethes aeneus]